MPFRSGVCAFGRHDVTVGIRQGEDVAKPVTEILLDRLHGKTIQGGGESRSHSLDVRLLLREHPNESAPSAIGITSIDPPCFLGSKKLMRQVLIPSDDVELIDDVDSNWSVAMSNESEDSPRV